MCTIRSLRPLGAVSTSAMLAAVLFPSIALAQDAAASVPTTTIVLGATTTITGDGAVLDGSDIGISAAGVYAISGGLADGMIHVDAPDAEVTLLLQGATISNADGPAIYVEQAAQATVELADGTANSLTDGGESDQDAALYSVPTVIITGTGALDVDATFEGISSTVDIRIEDGDIRVVAGEDGLNANEDGVSDITIAGGSLYVETAEGDGIDSNGTLHISGGSVFTQGAIVDANAGLDADGEISFRGGTVIATGSMMGIPGDTSTQESVYADLGATQSAGTLVSIQSGGSEIVTFAPAIDFRTILVSTPELADGVSYDVYVGGSSTSTAVDGVYAAGGYTPGELATSVTTELPEAGFGPGRGGRPGGPGGQPPAGGPGGRPEASAAP